MVGNAFSRYDLLERLDRLAAEIPGGLPGGHPLSWVYVGQVHCNLGRVLGRFGQGQGNARERPQASTTLSFI